MRKNFLKTIMVLGALTLYLFPAYAQSPEKMSYQAVIRNSSDALVTNTQIGMEINIRQGSVSGTIVYSETQTPTTNANGLVSIEIGGGTGFNTIDWSAGPYFIETKTAVAPPLTTYTITGTSQLLSVPYALHAKTAENFTGTITETDPVFTASEAANITATNITNLNNLSGVNTGDQDITGIATNEQAIKDTAAQIRADIPDVSGFLTSYTETDPRVPTGTETGDMQYWNGSSWVTVVAGNEGETLQMIGGVPTWTVITPPFPCGVSITIAHDSGSVAPQTKTVTYGTILTDLTGSNKCWITQNLGASIQASSATDNTEAAAGWYWQFNHKQGYNHDGTTRTPSTTWITSINENSDWTAVNDPCTILLGTGWRIPTKTEWENADANGGWDNYSDTYSSVLKLHAAGYLLNSDGSLNRRGSHGYYWNSTQTSSPSGWSLYFNSSSSHVRHYFKAYGLSVRCLRD